MGMEFPVPFPGSWQLTEFVLTWYTSSTEVEFFLGPQHPTPKLILFPSCKHNVFIYQKCWPCWAADASLERRTIKCASSIHGEYFLTLTRSQLKPMVGTVLRNWSSFIMYRAVVLPAPSRPVDIEYKRINHSSLSFYTLPIMMTWM